MGMRPRRCLGIIQLSCDWHTGSISGGGDSSPPPGLSHLNHCCCCLISSESCLHHYYLCYCHDLLSRQYNFIFSFMPTFFFLSYFNLSHVTLLSHESHDQSHDGSPDLSHDEGTWSVTWPWTIFTSHMSHYDFLLCVSSILSLQYDSLYLISDSPGSYHVIDSYCHIIPYSMMSLHMCTYLFLVHL